MTFEVSTIKLHHSPRTALPQIAAGEGARCILPKNVLVLRSRPSGLSSLPVNDKISLTPTKID